MSSQPEKVAPKLYLPKPIPLVYAYLCEASYSDAEQAEDGSWRLTPKAIKEEKREGEKDFQERVADLQAEGWFLAYFEFKEESGYSGQVWVNEKTEQVVIAHRGSANARSWATDWRSVVRCKPSVFVRHSLEMLKNPAFLHYRDKGFRPSVTGHSLGGFLAQACVGESYLRGEAYERTYCEDISAVVFDSPGAADFIDDHIGSNLEAEKLRLPTQLNIVNFCASPTIVSAFGRRYGIIYQLEQASKVWRWKSIGTDHRLGKNILPWLEELQTGGVHWSEGCIRILRWPEIVDTKIAGMKDVGEKVKEVVTDGVFWALNKAWSVGRAWVTGQSEQVTLVDSALGGPGNPLINYAKLAVGEGIDPVEFETALKAQMKAQYQPGPRSGTTCRMAVECLDYPVYAFMQDIKQARSLFVGNASDGAAEASSSKSAEKIPFDFGWDAYLKSVYGADFDVGPLSLDKTGGREELVLRPGGPFKNVYQAVNHLQMLLRENGVVSFGRYVVTVMREQFGGTAENREKIDEIQKALQQPKGIELYTTEVGEGLATVLAKKEDWEHFKYVFDNLKPNQSLTAFKAKAKTGIAAVMGEENS